MNSDDLKLSRRIENLIPWLVMLTLALLVLVPAPAGAVDKFIIGDRVVVNNAAITVRTLPTEGGSPGTSLGNQALGVQGTVLAGPITAENGATYWQIDFDTGLDGWSAETFLDKATIPPTPTPTPPPPSAKFIIGDRVVVNNADITVRTLPTEGGSPGTSLGNQALGVQGTVLAGPITAANGATYWQLDFDTGLDGWSAETFLDKATIPPTPTPTPPPSALFAIGERVHVVNTTINVRASPGGTLLGTQPVGSQGRVLAGPEVTPNGVIWYQIDYDSGVDGWSGQDNLALADTTVPPPVTPLPPSLPNEFVIGARVQVVNTTINVRASPGGTLLGTQPVGSLGTVLAGPTATPNGVIWYQIDYDSGVDGWSGQDNLDTFGSHGGSADLALSLTDTSDPMIVNGQLIYTITVTNNGPGIATGIRVVDFLPPEALHPGPPDSSQGECRGTVRVDCDLGRLAARAEATVTINVMPTVVADLSNTATVASETDPNPANNSETEMTTVRPPPDLATANLAITAVAEANPGTSDQGFTYRLTVKNDGPDTATGVQLTNDLPRGIALGPVTASQANCSDTDPMQCTLGTLPTGAEETVRIDVIRVMDTGTLPNRAVVNGHQHDPNTENNFALTSALDVLTPRTTCDSKRCRLTLICNLSSLRSCENQVTLFVDTRARRDTSARRLSDERAARPPRVRFAAAISSLPGGETENVLLKLTPKAKKLAGKLGMKGKKKLRAVMEIRNHVGGGRGIDRIPFTVRLK